MTVVAEILRIRTPRAHRRRQLARSFEFVSFWLLMCHAQPRALRGMRLWMFWSTR